jgi:hypothetical protein
MWYLEHGGIEIIPLNVSASKSHLQKEKVTPYFLSLSICKCVTMIANKT